MEKKERKVEKKEEGKESGKEKRRKMKRKKQGKKQARKKERGKKNNKEKERCGEKKISERKKWKKAKLFICEIRSAQHVINLRPAFQEAYFLPPLPFLSGTESKIRNVLFP